MYSFLEYCLCSKDNLLTFSFFFKSNLFLAKVTVFVSFSKKSLFSVLEWNYRKIFRMNGNLIFFLKNIFRRDSVLLFSQLANGKKEGELESGLYIWACESWLGRKGKIWPIEQWWKGQSRFLVSYAFLFFCSGLNSQHTLYGHTINNFVPSKFRFQIKSSGFFSLFSPAFKNPPKYFLLVV